MHVKLKILACILTIVMVFSNITCFANQENTDYDLVIEKLSIDNDTGVVIVSGKANATKVTMIVNRPDSNGNVQDDIPGQSNIADLVYTIAEAATASDGSFEFTFEIPFSNAGTYYIRIGVKGFTFQDTTDRSGAVTRLSDKERETVLSQFEAASTSELLDDFFQNNAHLFALPSTCGEEFCEIVIDYRSAYYQKGVKRIAEINGIVNAAGEIYKLDSVTTVKELDAFLTDNADLLGINAADENYIKNKSAVQNTLLSLISGAKPVAKWTTIKNRFMESLILTAFNNAKKTEMDALLKTYSTALNIDVTGSYNSVDPIEMAKALYNKDFIQLSQITDTFNKTLSTLPLIDSGKGGGGAGRVYNVKGAEGLTAGNADVSIGNTFTDIGSAAWASEAILALKNKGIINGMTQAQFCPNNSVTREQFVKMVVVAFGSQWSEGISSFSDVEGSAWYASYIKKAVNAGVINGQQEGIFGIGQSITRQDVSVILYRIMKDKISSSEIPSFKDYDSISSYAQDAVCAMYSSNILSGDDKGCFNPLKACTRAEAAKLIYGALALMEKEV